MLLSTTLSQRVLTRLSKCPPPSRHLHWMTPARLKTPRSLPSRRCYAQIPKSPQPPRPKPPAEELRRQAKAAAGGAEKSYQIAETLLIYHAGTGRTTFLAMVKVTTLFLGAFFTFIVVPSYVKAEKPLSDTALVAIGGLVPFFFVSYTTSPFVTHAHIHLPTAARASRAALERFAASGAGARLPGDTSLTLTTMSVIGKPRYSKTQVQHLRPARKRLGIINYVRSSAGGEQEGRKWYNLRPVSNFCVQEGGAGGAAGRKGKGPGAGKGKKSAALTEVWLWEAVRESVHKSTGDAKQSDDIGKRTGS